MLREQYLKKTNDHANDQVLNSHFAGKKKERKKNANNQEEGQTKEIRENVSFSWFL